MTLPPNVQIKTRALFGTADDKVYRLFVGDVCIREQLSPFGESEIPEHVECWKLAKTETEDERSARLKASYERATAGTKPPRKNFGNQPMDFKRRGRAK